MIFFVNPIIRQTEQQKLSRPKWKHRGNGKKLLNFNAELKRSTKTSRLVIKNNDLVINNNKKRYRNKCV